MPASEQPGHEQLEVELSRHLINSCSFFFLETVPTFRSSSLDDRDDSLNISTRNRQLEILFDFAISLLFSVDEITGRENKSTSKVCEMKLLLCNVKPEHDNN